MDAIRLPFLHPDPSEGDYMMICRKSFPIAMAGIAVVVLLHGCGGGGSEDPTTVARQMRVQSPADLAQSSAEN